MNKEMLESEYLCSFEPDDREITLSEKLADYYRTTENMNSHYAGGHWHLFKRWCSDRGYSQDDINKAKRTVLFWSEC